MLKEFVLLEGNEVLSLREELLDVDIFCFLLLLVIARFLS